MNSRQNLVVAFAGLMFAFNATASCSDEYDSAHDLNYVPERSFYILVRDYEQEACFVLMLWAMAILAFKGVAANRQQRQLLQSNRFALWVDS